MTHTIKTPATPAAGASTRSRAISTGALLRCGVVAGPVFVAAAGVQVLTRDGFDLRKHAISMLSLGDPGWVQITTFLVTGLLVVACAVGMRRVLRPGRAATWGPRLVAAYGAGLVAAGIFRTDPAFGFPAGAPLGMPDHFSWHAIVHSVAAIAAFLSLTAACFVFARRFAVSGRRRWVAYCVATGVATPVLGVWPSTDGAGVRLAIAAVLAWAWLAAVAAWLRTVARS